jgi:hypothetical protein
MSRLLVAILIASAIACLCLLPAGPVSADPAYGDTYSPWPGGRTSGPGSALEMTGLPLPPAQPSHALPVDPIQLDPPGSSASPAHSGLAEPTEPALLQLARGSSGLGISLPSGLTPLGSPVLTTTPATLDFGTVYVGATKRRWLVVTNAGTDNLEVTGWTSSDPALTAAFTPMLLTPAATQPISVTFAPAVSGSLSATFTITSNAGPAAVPAIGSGLLPPRIAVTPTSLLETLPAGSAVTRTLTISNYGSSELTFSIAAESGSVLVISDTEVVQWSDPIGTILTNNKIPYTSIRSSQLASAELWRYPMIIIPSLQGNAYNAAFNANIGKIEAYIDAGGYVLMSYCEQSTFSPFRAIPFGGSGNLYGYNANYLVQPGHPIFAGVANPYWAYSGYVSYNYLSGLLPGDRVLVTGGSSPGGDVIMIERSHGAGMLVAGGQNFEAGWVSNSGSGSGKILDNMIPYYYRRTASWLTASPATGAVTAGASKTVIATLNAATLISGTHLGALTAWNNDPYSARQATPVTLTVIGTPALSVTPATVAFGQVYVGVSRTLALTVTNAGTADLEVLGLTSADPEVTPAFAPAPLAPYLSRAISVTFAPATSRTLASTLTITSTAGVTTVQVTGSSVPPPRIHVTPSALAEVIPAGGALTRTLTVSNNGSSDLTFSLGVASSGVLLIQDHVPWDIDFIGIALANNSIPYTTIGSSQLPAVDLHSYKMVIIPSVQGSAYNTAFNASLGKIEAFIDAGGVVLMNYCEWSAYSPFRAIPFGSTSNYGPNSSAYIVSPAHPIFAGVPNPYSGGSGSCHYLTGLLDSDRVLVTGGSAPGGEVLMIERAHAAGLLVAGSQAFEAGWSWTRPEGVILSNMIPYYYNNWLPWPAAQPRTATVAATRSVVVSVTLDATDRISGTYRSTVAIRSNDPFTPLVTVPVTLTVVGAPVLTTTPQALNFGDVFVGLSRTLPLTLTNAGTADLEITGWAGSHPAVTATLVPLTLTPQASGVISVSFAPAISGALSASLNITSNAGLTAVPLAGHGLLPPRIHVSPAGLTQTVDAKSTVTTTFTISNQGSGDLTFAVSGLRTLAGALLIQDTLAWGYDAMRTILAENSIPYTTITSSQLAATELSPFQIIIIPSAQYPSYDTAINANLARFEAYIDSGGVLLMSINQDWSAYANRLIPFGGEAQGKFHNNQIIIEPDHPIFAGVPNPYSGSYQSQRVHVLYDLLRGDRLLVTGDEYYGSTPIMIERRHGAGMLVAGGQAFEWEWGNGEPSGIILENMIPYYFSQPEPWLSVHPVTGTIPAGGATIATVTLDADRMIGGVYTTTLAIQSSDPLMPLVTVPVTLTVIGTPLMTFTPTTLAFDPVYVGASSTRSVTVTNTGNGDLEITGWTSSEPSFSLDYASTPVVPDASRAISVTFAPIVSGTVTASVTISTSAGLAVVSVNGAGVLPPRIQVSPTSLVQTLAAGSAATRTLTISNHGDTNLAFEVRGLRPVAGHGVGGVLLIQDHAAWDYDAMRTILLNNNIPYTTISSTELGVADLGAYTMLIVPSLQYFNYYDALAANIGRIQAYIDDGGIVLLSFCSGAQPFSLLPFGGLVWYGYEISNYIVEPGHPIFAGVTNPYSGTSASFNFLMAGLLPDDRVLVTGGTSPGGNVIMIERAHGAGMLVAGGQTFELGWGHGEATGVILANMIPSYYASSSPWLGARPVTGTVAPGGSTVLTVTLDAAGLISGTYAAEIAIQSNDPLTPTLTVPVSLTVIGAPALSVSPVQLDFGTMRVGITRTLPLTLTNAGTANLAITAQSYSDPAVSATLAPAVLSPHASRIISVTFAPVVSCQLSATLTFTTNAGVTGVAVEGRALSLEADFVGWPTSGPAPLTVAFTNTSTGAFSTVLWTFGDGVSTSLPSPSHTYAAVGAYTVTLSVAGPGISDLKTKVAYIHVLPQHTVYLPVVLRAR